MSSSPNPIIQDLLDDDDDNIDNTGTADEVVYNATESSRGRSDVWEKDFTMIKPTDSKDGKRHGICNHCGKDYAAPGGNGTSNLRRHLAKCPSLKNRDIGQMMMSVNGKLLSRQINQKTFRELLALCAINHGYPLSFVEHKHFRNLVEFLNPDAKPIVRNTLKVSMVDLYEREKKLVKQTLISLLGRICLTSDMWTSATSRHYLSLTAHFIDPNWKIQSLVLNFLHVPPPHNGITIPKVIIGLLREWGIEKKVFTITLDNVKYNDTVVKELTKMINTEERLPCGGNFFHIRCCAHVLNLIVQDGYKKIDAAAIKLRDGIKYIDASEGRKISFVECASSAGCSTQKGLWLDCVTRWNSTHEMFERALTYRNAFTALAAADKNFVWNLEPEEWVKIEKICVLMKPFSAITTLFSGSKYPTANLFLPNVNTIEVDLIKHMQSSDAFISEMATAMKEKFNKYWGDSYNKVLAMAAILDPERRLSFVKFAYTKLNVETALEKTEEVVELMTELFNDYYRQDTVNVVQPTNAQHLGLDAEFDNFETNTLSSSRSSLEVYMGEARFVRDPKFDIIGWWKDNEARFPDLAVMARDILSIPITSVASESAFSLGGRVLTKYRHKLLPENAQALITSKSWLSRERNLNLVKPKDFGEEIVLPSTEEVTQNQQNKRMRL